MSIPEERWWESLNPTYDWQELYNQYPDVNWSELYGKLPKKILGISEETDVRREGA